MYPWGTPWGAPFSENVSLTASPRWLHRMALLQAGIPGTHLAQAGSIRCSLRSLEFGSEAEEIQGLGDSGELTNEVFSVVHDASYVSFWFSPSSILTVKLLSSLWTLHILPIKSSFRTK